MIAIVSGSNAQMEESAEESAKTKRTRGNKVNASFETFFGVKQALPFEANRSNMANPNALCASMRSFFADVKEEDEEDAIS